MHSVAILFGQEVRSGLHAFDPPIFDNCTQKHSVSIFINFKRTSFIIYIGSVSGENLKKTKTEEHPVSHSCEPYALVNISNLEYAFVHIYTSAQCTCA